MLNKLLEEQGLRTPELLTEGVPGNIMNIYMKWLNQGVAGYEKGAPYAIQSVHEQLLLAWYTLDFHFDDDRPWRATEKGKNIHDKVMNQLQMKSSSGKVLSNGMLNDAKKDNAKVWDSIFDWKENKKRWGVFEKGLQINDTKWSGKVHDAPDEFFINQWTNPYGDICKGGDPLKGKGFYLDMFVKRKFVERCKPGESA